MHVLIIPSEEFVPLHQPLAGTFQYDQAKILSQAGYKIGVISVELKYSLPMLARAFCLKVVLKKANNLTDRLSLFQVLKLLYKKILVPSAFITVEKKDGINIYRSEGFYWWLPSEKTDHLYWVKAGISTVRQYIRQNGKPDIIHAHNALYSGLLARKIKLVYSIPYVLTEHSSYYARNLYHPSLLPKALNAYKAANKTLVVSRFLGEKLENIFGKTFQCTVLPNVVEPVFERTPLKFNRSGSFLFISVGNLIKLKQHSLLIKAFHFAFPGDNNVRLQIIGEGEEEAKLKHLIKDLCETERILLKGRFSKEEVFNKLNEANVLCLQSEYETFGVSVLEALFRGVPVITTRCGGPDEIVTSQDGIRVAIYNEHMLSNALVEIKKNYNNYDSGEIRKKAIERFGAQIFLKQLSDHYRSSIGLV